MGWIRISGKEEFIREVQFSDSSSEEESRPPTGIFLECIRQLEAYFSGTLQQFDLPLSPEGTAFQETVWSELLKIPYGETRSYAQMAKELGNPKVIRAAAAANGANPIGILIPCHRVVGSGGKLVGYAGGLWRKDWLLKHEARFSGRKTQLELF